MTPSAAGEGGGGDGGESGSTGGQHKHTRSSPSVTSEHMSVVVEAPPQQPLVPPAS